MSKSKSKQSVRFFLKATPVLAVLSVTAYAAVPTFWRLENQADFLAGDTDGVSIDSDGRITLAPAANALLESTEPQFWSLAMARSGNIYAGTGNDGRVLEIDASGNETVIADFDELQVHALAVNRSGTVFAGTSPRGAVYEIQPGGAYEVFFDPDERYIWALAFDSTGRLLVATGDPARIHRVSPSGESEVLFTSEETHIVSLTVDRNDRILAGTDPNGLVLALEPNGTTSVVFDTPFREVRAIVNDSRGNIYAATVNGEGRASTPEPETTTTSTAPATAGGTATVTVSTSLAPQIVSPPSTTSPASSGSQAGGLYRIDSEGAADLLWESRSNTPLSLSLATDDRLMVGTGSEGRIFLVSQDKTSSLLLSVEADQVTAILPGSEGQIYLATSNPAKLYRLNRGRRTEGIYVSPAKDTSTVSSWGKIRWEARLPAGAGLTLETRSGNSAEPDNTWSAWSQAYTQSTGEQVTSPRGRFFQWRAVLSSSGETTPELHNVTAVYLQQNIAPQVTEIKIHAPGQVYQKPLVSSGEIEILGMADTVTDPNAPASGGSAAAGGSAASMSMMALARPIYRKGIQTVTWSASDPNKDELRFDVEYRAEGESFWRPLRTGLTDSVVAWDTVAMPDGRYTLRVVASDAPDNPGDLARTGERTSRSFEVDNSPPSVTGLTAEREANGHRVRFVAQDAVSPIQAVEYSVNSGIWNIVFPNDGIADSPQESFDFLLTGYQNGVFTLVVKVTDGLENTATARIELR